MPKLTLNLSDNVNDILGELAESDGLSKVEVLRRALVLFDFVSEETSKGFTLALINEEGKIKRTITI